MGARESEMKPKGDRFAMVSKLEREQKDPFGKAGSDRVVVYSPAVLRSALFNAVSQARLDDCKLCVERGASVDWRDEGEASCGLTTLQAAICATAKTEERKALVSYLLSQSVNVEDIDYVESTALHFAAALGNGEIIDQLIKRGANPNVYDAENLTPLHLAVNQGHTSCVRALVNNWARVDLSDTDITSPRDRDRGEARKMVTVPGASLYIASRGTALHVCAATDRPSIAEYLIDAGKADVNSPKGPHGCTPLHIACRAGFARMCRLLVAKGANINAKDESGEEPLHRCVEKGDLEIARLLLKNGANAACTNKAGVTPLHLAAAFARPDFVDLLAENGADVDRSCTKLYDDWDGGRTPMHYAAHAGDLETFKRLTALGGDFRKLSSIGWPPLFYAVEMNRKDVVEFILARDVEEGVHCLVEKSRTPLMVAAMHNAVESAELLMAAFPFTVNHRDDMGRTALHWAAKRAQQEVMQRIIDCGGDASIRDQNQAKAADLFPNLVGPAPKRQWEEARRGPQGEATWNYKNVMENTSIRYMKRTMAARREREIARERQCNWCQRYSFDALRCAACKSVYYCNSNCQLMDWNSGGHRLKCVTQGVKEMVSSKLKTSNKMSGYLCPKSSN